ncbi:MAG: SDR family NAD(P)-dependent oxidoreductase [Acidimicrobiaceae bacterium]|nr:SDR family NAD(P)-dependent oxidoreductase [Acidimicrobiia bacterium]MCY4495206.1 SDR family NAD(P)-dependent oxidoreductase [Acidimicrobiaceae bacterium]
MEQLNGRIAVVTGGASGIGRAVALALAAESMRVVVADIEQPPLDATVAEIAGAGGIAVGIVCDVSDWESVDALRARCTEEFGPADVVMNNAGVAGGGSISAVDLKAWEWTLAVNLWGVIHGVKAFLPAMVERGEGHIVNTASIAGHLTSTGMGAYNTSKHAVVGFSETLQQEMLEGDTGVGVTCLCPGFVATNIINSERNRQERYRDPGPDLGPDDDDLDGTALGDASSAIADLYGAQMDPAKVAEQVVGAVRTNQFWLFTDDLADGMIRERHADIERKATPTKRTHLVELMMLKGDS